MTKDQRDHVRDLIRDEGVMVAYLAAVDVCRDKKAPPPARATAATLLFRAGGMLEKTEADREKAPSEMTMEELDASRRRLLDALSALRGVQDEVADVAESDEVFD